MSNIIVIDDNKLHFNDLKCEFKGKGFNLIHYSDPLVFKQNTSLDEVKNSKLIIVDYDFYGDYSAVDSKISEYIREKFDYKGKIVLCTLHVEFGDELEYINKNYDQIINREKDLYWDNLSGFLH